MINPESLERDPKGCRPEQAVLRNLGLVAALAALPRAPERRIVGLRQPASGIGGKVHERHQDAVDRRGGARRLRSEGRDGGRSRGV
jgi:hypothetical protein